MRLKQKKNVYYICNQWQMIVKGGYWCCTKLRRVYPRWHFPGFPQSEFTLGVLGILGIYLLDFGTANQYQWTNINICEKLLCIILVLENIFNKGLRKNPLKYFTLPLLLVLQIVKHHQQSKKTGSGILNMTSDIRWNPK